MTEYKAKLSHLRIAPRKVRLVAGLIRGENAVMAQHLLKASTKRSADPMLKLLNSAIANAKEQNKELDESNLYIKQILVNEGPKLKRYMPVARGMVHEIQKKTSHISLVLVDKEDKDKDDSGAQNNKSKTSSESNKEKEKTKAKTKAK
ncbi:MAG: 50S ribosomal protein L22 [Candidatus Spechtbacterales bacterium]|nr:50S ribosomal protein L22 [Candidatus Spechtbacterales bacterium]